MRYLQTSKDWYLNEDTLNFVPGSKILGAGVITVPWYLWTHGKETEFTQVVGFSQSNGNISNNYRVTRLVSSFRLGNLVIEHLEKLYRTRVSVTDKSSGVVVNFGVASTVNSGIQRGHIVPKTVSHFLTIDGNPAAAYTLDMMIYGVSFKGASNLASIETSNRIVRQYRFGLYKEKSDIFYEGKLLGKRFVYMYGSWAILLDDALCFDSIVVLKQTKATTIHVAKFLYSVNPVVVKMMIMSKK